MVFVAILMFVFVWTPQHRPTQDFSDVDAIREMYEARQDSIILTLRSAEGQIIILQSELDKIFNETQNQTDSLMLLPPDERVGAFSDYLYRHRKERYGGADTLMDGR